jgi:predicted Zn-dependent protease
MKIFARFGSLLTLSACLAAAAAPAVAADEPGGVAVERNSWLANLVPAEAVEQAAVKQYGSLKQQAAAKGVLVPPSDPRVVRLRTVAQRILPHVKKWNPRAEKWPWEVNLIASKDINAFCMPGGKIAFFTGILDTLKLTDDEVAAVMGHEIAHALREHARERIAKSQATQVGVGALSQILGLGDLGRLGLNMGGQLLTLKFSRDDESEADVVGLDVAARAGYDPRAGVVLWEKMAKVNKGGMPDWLSTHPSGPNRIDQMQRRMKDVLPLYAKARGTTVDRLPAYQSNL